MPQTLQILGSDVRLRRAKISFILSLLWCFTFTSLMLVVRLLPPSDAICDQKGIIFSPLQGAIQYDWLNYGDMWTQGLKYRTPVNTSVSEETNEAWLELLTDVDLSVPEHVLDALGQKTDYRWRAHPSGGYAAKLGGFHQMACLNEIRQHVKADLDNPKRIEKRQIVDNCLELLRQKFMCDMDATPYLLKYDKKAVRGDVPDMDTLHKCRDYGKLRTLVQNSDHTKYV